MSKTVNCLDDVIENILCTQGERISNHLVKASQGFPSIGLAEEDIPEVSVGYNFTWDDCNYTVKIALIKDFD